MNNLLEKVKVLIKYNSKLLDYENTQFNIFKICGVNHKENSHSSILAEFLRTDGTHGFKEKFLEAFLDVLKSEKIINDQFNFHSTNASVYTEFVINNGRIDILITNKAKQAIIIENKIYASDQYQQLKRYNTYGENEFNSNFILLYLTLYGNEASEESSKDVDYVQISYSDIIIKWLDKCIEISARNAIVRETLIQYINHIKELTDQSMTTQNNDELIELLSKKENIQAALLIGDNINAIKNHLVNKIFLPQLEIICKDLDLDLINQSKELDWFNESWAGFKMKKQDWNYFKIATEFGLKGLKECIIGVNHIGDNRNEKTFNELKTKFRSNNSGWVWKQFPKYSNWNKYDALIAILNGEMADIFKYELKQILEITKDLEM